MTRRLLWAGLLAAAFGVAPLWAGDGAAAVVDPKAAFTRLKSLVGEWEGQPLAPNAPPPRANFRLTGNGTALMETLFGGTDHEMVTIYHMAGDDLVLAHYCAGGTQPRMKLAAGAAEGELRFDFAGGDNVDAAKGSHMHAARFPTLTGDHYVADWTVFSDGKATMTHHFVMSRAASGK